MVKETHFFRKQAEKAERAARLYEDPETVESLRAMASGYRRQAEILKAMKKTGKRRDRKRLPA